jgi:hypothetical protein
MSAHQPLRVLLYQDLPGRWSARSLEHDLSVDGGTIETVLDRILTLIFAHIDYDRRHGHAPLSAFPAAPRRFWDAFEKARPMPSVNRRTTDPQLSYGPIMVSISEARPVIERPATIVPNEFAVSPEVSAADGQSITFLPLRRRPLRFSRSH